MTLNTELELIIDKYGMSKVLFSIAEICAEKADHIVSNWQDASLAKEWLKDQQRIEKIAAITRFT